MTVKTAAEIGDDAGIDASGAVPSEAVTVARARDGDRQAFATLVRAHQDRVFRFLLRLVDDRDEAMDLTQETFLRSFRALAEWRPEAPFRAWLFRIARNLAFDLLRRRERVGFVGFDDLAPVDGAAHWPDTAPRPEQRLDDRRNLAALERALRDLPAAQREVLLLHELEGMSYAEMAATLEINTGTVRSRLARARAAALEHYQRHTGEKRHG